MKRLLLPFLFLLITLTVYADNDVSPPVHKFYIPIVTRPADPRMKAGYAWSEINEDQTDLLKMQWHHGWNIESRSGYFSFFIPHFSCDVHHAWEYDDDVHRKLFQDLRSLGHNFDGELLFLNEPDLIDQCNRTPSQAAYMYAKVLEIQPNAVIVGPQVSHFEYRPYDYYQNWRWLREFLGYVDARGIRMPDYIGIHDYNNTRPAAMLDSLFDLLAEFPNAPAQGYVTELGASDPDMLRLILVDYQVDDRIVKYAWFDPVGRQYPNAALIDEGGELTELGEVWVEMHE